MSAEKLMQVSLKQKVKDLEIEVSELKTKLSQLRKAKSTTIVKRKREVIYVGGGGEERRSANEPISTPTPSNCQSPGQTDISKKDKDVLGRDEDPTVVTVLGYSKENDLMKQKDEETTLHTEQEDSIRKLFRRVSELNDENIALTIENKDLACKVAQLTTELSVNEAKRYDQEEKMKAELSAEWRQKYDSWMAEMERKMSEINQNSK